MNAKRPINDHTLGARAGLYAIPQILLYSMNFDLAGNIASIIILLSLLVPRISFRVCHYKIHKIIIVFSLLLFVVLGNVTSSPSNNFWATMYLPNLGFLDVVYFLIGMLIVFTIFHSFKVSEIDSVDDNA